MKYKTAEVTGALLDAAVALIEGFGQREGHIVITMVFSDAPNRTVDNRPAYSTSWAHGGPIIEREPWALPRVNTNAGALHLGKFAASTPGGFDYYGPTPLIAAMRAFVASRLGEEVELP